MQKIFLATLLSLAAMVNLYSEDSNSGWSTDFEAAKKMAAEKKMPILADFSGSDWCGWCIKLDSEVFVKKEFKEFAKDNLVLFVADFPRKAKQDDKIKKQNNELLSKYSVEGFPTVLLMDAGGNVIARTGYQKGGAVAYVEHLKKIISGRKKE